AGKVRAFAAVQQPQPAADGGGPFAQVTQEQALLKEQLGVVRAKGPAGAAGDQGGAALAEVVVALRDQRVELADDGIGRLRPFQAAQQEGQGLLAAAQLVVERAQVEQGERVLRVLGVLQLEQAQVALELPAAHGGVLIPNVMNNHVGEADLAAQVADGR